jgi:hypothetical protein
MSNSPTNRLSQIPETDAYPLLERLLLRMGCTRVYITHGPQELGRDLVFLDHNRLGEEEWRAVQLKRRITGSLSRPTNLRTLVSQCDAALDIPWRTPDGRDIRLKEMWLVILASVTESAKATLSEEFLYKNRVRIIDAPQLDSLLRKYLPDEAIDTGRSVHDYLEALTTFGDSLDDYITQRFEQRFGLSDVYVRPDATLSYLSLNQIERLEATGRERTTKESQGLRQIEDWLPELVRLGSAKMPAALHLHLTITLRRVLAVFRASSTLGPYEDASQKATRLLRDFCGRIGFGFVAEGNVFSRIPPGYRYTADIAREDLDEVVTDLGKLRDTRLLAETRGGAREGTDNGALSSSGALTLEGAREAALHPLLVPLAEIEWFRSNDPTSLDDRQVARRLQARVDQALNKLWRQYRTSVDYEDPIAALSMRAARFLAQKVEARGAVSRKHWEEKEQELLGALREVQGYLDRLRKLVLDGLRELRQRLKPGELGPTGADSAELIELQMLSGLAGQLLEIPATGLREVSVDAMTFASQAKALIVEAELGLGKTTLLKCVARASAQNKVSNPALPTPYFVRLARVSPTSQVAIKSLKKAGEAEAGMVAAAPDDEEMWLLDGFDEVQDELTREAILEWTLNVGIRSRKVILTSRPHALPPFLPGFVRIRLERFSPQRVEDLVRAFPWNREGQDTQFLDYLEGNADIKSLAEVPLLLTLLLLVARSAGVERIPRARKELYELIVDLFLHEWDFSKGVKKVRAIEDDAWRKKALEKISFGLYARGHRFFGIEQFVEEFEKVWVGEGESIQTAVRFFGELVRDCVIVPESRDIFGFFHLSMQEYLAAKELASDVDSRRVVKAVRDFCRKDGWWEEVLVFYAALKGDIAVLLEDLHEKGVPLMREGRVDRSFIRLLERMLAEAPFTDPMKTKARGGVAAALAAMDFGGRRRSWRRMR